VQQLEKRGVVKSLAHGVYDLTVSIRTYIQFVKDNARGVESSKEEKEQRIRLTAAKANLAELSHGELIGELLRASVVRRQDFQLGRILRNNLESIPDRISAIVAAESSADIVHDLISREIRDSQDQVIEAMNLAEVDDAALDITRRNAKESINNE
jgi:phage terminase Nu1 subunit (DNA packaging protein)